MAIIRRRRTLAPVPAGKRAMDTEVVPDLCAPPRTV